MQEKVRVWLNDINNAIEEIDSFLPDTYEFADFQRDLKTKRAIERNIEIIGEAMSRILKVPSDILISDPRKIVDTRNRIIHGYDNVSDEVLWTIVVKYLPILDEEIKDLLSKD